MAIEVQCAGCDKTLQVDEQYAGQTAVCPVCHTSFEIPESGAVKAETAEPAVWWMKTPEGRVYGPIGKGQLDRWVSDGRISHDCELRNNEQAPWTSAERTFPVLSPTSGVSRSRGNPFAAAPIYRNVLTPGGVSILGPSPYMSAHRGGLILVLGILAFIVACPVLSFLAWTMGTTDLREMREGRMDPSGMNKTQAGMMLGMLLSVASIISIMGLVFFGIFRLAL